MPPVASSRRYLIVCHDYDEAALWLHDRLSTWVGTEGDLVKSSELDLATRWHHRLGLDDPDIEVDMADGRRWRGGSFEGVLNRLIAAPASLANFAIAEDRDYAAAEAMAFAMSWLSGLPNILNPPTPQGMGGAWRHMSEWSMLASAARLTVPDYHQTDGDGPEIGQRSLAPAGTPLISAVAFRNDLFGAALPANVGAACRRMAEASGADLLGINLFEIRPGCLAFAYASPWPDLRIGSTALVKRLALALCGQKL